MTYRDFCYWLDGFLEEDAERLGLMYLITIKLKVKEVIKQEELKTQTFVDLKGESWPISSPQDFYNK